MNGIVNPNYKYDANGNLPCVMVTANCNTGVPASSYRYTAANMVSRVVQGTVTLRLAYDSEHGRIVQHLANGATTTDTTYLNDPMSGAASELVVQGTTSTWHDYLTADGRMVGERFTTGAASSWNWFVLDHLGSVSIVTDQAKQVVTNGWLSYDAWGRMRNADGTDDASCNKPDLSPSTRGFTGQEQMPGVCLINLNARIYDPTLGKFLTPDSVVQSIYEQ